jgi:hypothetical protein
MGASRSWSHGDLAADTAFRFHRHPVQRSYHPSYSPERGGAGSRGKNLEHDVDESVNESGRDPELSARDLEILAFERAWWRRGGRKEEAIREEFGISAARYYQVLGALIETPAALREDPMLVKRLQRLRDARTVRRADLRRRPSS